MKENGDAERLPLALWSCLCFVIFISGIPLAHDFKVLSHFHMLKPLMVCMNVCVCVPASIRCLPLLRDQAAPWFSQICFLRCDIRCQDQCGRWMKIWPSASLWSPPLQHLILTRGRGAVFSYDIKTQWPNSASTKLNTLQINLYHVLKEKQLSIKLILEEIVVPDHFKSLISSSLTFTAQECFNQNGLLLTPGSVMKG